MNNPFDRMNIGLRERPLSADHNRLQSQIDRTIRELSRAMLMPRTSETSAAGTSKNGFIGDGLRVVQVSPAAMSVQVNAGYGFIYDASDLPSDIGATDLEGVDDLSPFKPVCLVNPVTFAVPAAPVAPDTRIDIIEVRVDRRLENSVTRRQLDVATKSWLDHSFYKTLAFGHDGRTGVVTSPAASTAGLSYKIGTAANPGVAPATTSGYVKIAEINVDSGVASINALSIVDRRTLLYPGGLVPFSASWRLQYNGGAGLATLRHLCAPPSVELAMRAEPGGHGVGAIYVTGGEMAGIVGNISVHRGGGGAGTDFGVGAFVHSYFNPSAPIDPATMLSGEQAIIATAVPTIQIGNNQKYAKFPFASRYQSGATTDNSNALLDDLYVHFTGHMFY